MALVNNETIYEKHLLLSMIIKYSITAQKLEIRLLLFLDKSKKTELNTPIKKLEEIMVFLNIIILSLILICLSKNAYAYLDPGTGSYIFQMIAAAVLSSLLAIKIFWKRWNLLVN